MLMTMLECIAPRLGGVRAVALTGMLFVWSLLCSRMAGLDIAVAAFLATGTIVLGFPYLQRFVEDSHSGLAVNSILALLALFLGAAGPLYSVLDVIKILPAWIAIGLCIAGVAATTRSCRSTLITAYLVSLAGLLAVMLALSFLVDPFPLGSDSSNYVTWAHALRNAFDGGPVDAARFKLLGILQGGHDAWQPDVQYSFADAIGTRHTLYSEMLAGLFALGLTLKHAYLVQASLIAAGSALWFAIAERITASKAAGAAIVVLLFLDTHNAAAAMTAWREALVLLLFPLVLILLFDMLKNPRFGLSFALAVVAGSLLSISRYNLLILVLAVVCGAAFLLSMKDRSLKRALVFVLLLVMTAAGSLIAKSPTALYAASEDAVATIVGPLVASLGQLTQKSDPKTGHPSTVHDVEQLGSDNVVAEWREQFDQNPTEALTTAVQRLLFSPNPNWLRDTDYWVATKFYTAPEETLIYPGMTLLILTTPLIFVGIVYIDRGENDVPQSAIILVTLILLAASYTIFYGSFAGRQRMQALPLYYFFAVNGVLVCRSLLCARGERFRKS